MNYVLLAVTVCPEDPAMTNAGRWGLVSEILDSYEFFCTEYYVDQCQSVQRLRSDLKPMLESVTSKLIQDAKKKNPIRDCPNNYYDFVYGFYWRYGNDSHLERFLREYTNVGMYWGYNELNILEDYIWKELGPIPGQTEDFKAYSLMDQIYGQLSYYNERYSSYCRSINETNWIHHFQLLAAGFQVVLWKLLMLD